MRPLHPFDIPLTGINLVEASAGTGKTYNIASLYIRALIEYKRKVSEILVVTYTEAATKELKDRLQKRIRESVTALRTGKVPDGDAFLHELKSRVEHKDRAVELLQQAVRSFDEASVYTIHGFCYRALQEHAFESGAIFGAELIGDDTEVVLDVVDDYWRSWVNEASGDPLKRPLLKLLTDKGYSPDSLTAELIHFIGKPYLKVLPEEDPAGAIDAELRQLNSLYEALKEQWGEDRETIFSLLNAGHLSYYRTDWLEGWMGQMDGWLQGETPPIRLFDRYEKFVQSAIDASLKKSAEKKGITPPQHPFFRLAGEYEQTAESLQQYDVAFKRNLLHYLQQTINTKKDELQVLSFDDLLLKLNSALGDPGRGKRLAAVLRYKYPIALVDEFQDTDPIQYNIFRSIYGAVQREGYALFMIGDPKQSIYSFRGADIFAYLQAKRDADEGRVFSLNQNFRSVPGLLQGVETIFGRHPNPFLLEDIAFEPVQPGRDDYAHLTENGSVGTPIHIRELHPQEKDLPLPKKEAEELVATDTASEVVSLIQKGKRGEALIGGEPVKAKNIAVLVRTHKQADIISRALQSRNVKSVQYSQQSVFQSIEAEELERVMRAIAEPVNDTRIKSALATRLMGYSARDLLRLEEDETEWIKLLNGFANWHYAWQEHGFAFMFRAWLQDSKAFEHIIRYENGERMLTNVLHLGELIQAEEQENRRGTRGLIRWLARKRREHDLMLESEQLRLESDEELVKVVTMHRSKGLQYPIVFCPFLWHGPEFIDRGQPLVFHDGEDHTRAFLDLQGKRDPDRARRRLSTAREELAESVRLAYVALTRAEQRCYISWVHAGKSECSPLGYLTLPAETVDQVLTDIIDEEGTYRALEPGVIRQALEELAEASGGSIELMTISEVEQGRKNENDTDRPAYYHRKFTRRSGMEPKYGITSFSSLMRSREDTEGEPAYEQYFDEAYTEPAGEELSTGKNIFTFPRGPQPGTCIHKIFEEIDFRDLSGAGPIIEESLSLYHIDTGWKEVVEEMLGRVTAASLSQEDPGLKLSALGPEDFISELEFYYPTEAIDTHRLFSIVRGTQPGREVPDETRMRGFMKGFIDLVFRYNEKYYILDYKTNYLGDTSQDYTPAKLREAITDAAYDMQYHIYTLALHRYLSRRIQNYSYGRHFGGVFYLFVRGINEEGREGIFFGHPPAQRIEAMDQYIKEGKAHEA